MAGVFESLVAEILAVPVRARIGRVSAIGRGTVTVTGIADVAALGDRVAIGPALGGEVVALQAEGVTVLTDQMAEGVTMGTAVRTVVRGKLPWPT